MAQLLNSAAAAAARPLFGKIRNRKLLDAFRRVPRADFLDVSLRPHADADCPLPIGHAQTTSQPLVIARMIEMLMKNAPPASVLEIGAGCGYQTALLSLLCEKVTAIERIGTLAKQTAARLRALGYANVRVIHGDGFAGAAAAAPFDGIVLCAEHDAVPPQLVAQLATDGLLVMPLVGNGGVTRLVSVNAEGLITARREMVSFVPMLKGKH